jgi:hypothetical protein
MLRTLKAISVLCVFGLGCGRGSSEPAGSMGADSDAPHVGKGISAQSFANSGWSEPVNLGATVNSPANDNNATFSPDELSLYFTSNRGGGLGGSDLWVSRRSCNDCPWGVPLNLGAPVNSTGAEAAPRLSNDGHLLFFNSDRSGGHGSTDIYVSRRDNPNDDFGWGDAVNLGTDVNTAAAESGADYLQSAAEGASNLYFVRAPIFAGGGANLYVAPITRDGETLGPAVIVSELSDASGDPGHPSVRTDGREIFFQSSRVGGLGGFDLWTSTRRSAHEPWSAPVNLGAPLNTAFTDFQPTLSKDGRTLLFSSNRTGGFGGNDLWISTRTPNGR